jgi:hypothetical protein
MIAPPVVEEARVVPAAAVTAIGLEPETELPMVTVEAGDAERVTVTLCGVFANDAADEVWRLQLTVIAVTSTPPDLTAIPAANMLLVEVTSASRRRMALDLSILKCFIEFSF